MHALLLVDIHQVTFQLGYFIQDDTLIGFQLGFTRATHADTTTLTFQVSPQTGQARQHIFVLCQFDLCFCVGSLGAAGKYIEDQAGTVEYLHLKFFFDIAKLFRREFVVENNQSDFIFDHVLFYLL